ncbi:MAG: cysteine synthase family protein [Gammaproteobacteria bacterium]|nr:cysteine synthase family protein [Gammaproteobacteria bacterium]
MQKKQSILAAIGHTPFVEIALKGVDVPCFAKLEYLNPGGSIKDRSALYMIEEAERLGQLKRGYTVIEGSSGNQGIAVAMIGAVKGYAVIVTVPERTSSEKVATLKAYGAEVIVCKEHGEGTGYTEVARALHLSKPNSFMLNQYYNPQNIEAHYRSTAPEIWQQSEGHLTHMIMAMGSCGTVMGVARFLKEKNPGIQIIGVDAATSALSAVIPSPYRVEGIGVDALDGLFDRQWVDRIETVTDDEVFIEVKNLAREEGLMVGLSSAAVTCVLKRIAGGMPKNARIGMILADSGRAYLQKAFGL